MRSTKIRLLFLGVLLLFSVACRQKKDNPLKDDSLLINSMIDKWHRAASAAEFNNYFKYMTSDAVFVGTDPSEHWDLASFKLFCKPYFDKGKAWSFTSLDRHIYFNNDHSIAWFDELLNTQMKICRGSGVVIKEHNEWKIAHYVLSMTVPNDNTKEVVSIKSLIENRIIDSLSSNARAISTHKRN